MQSGRLETRAAAAITLVAVALRLWIGREVSFCGTPDSCYALGLAQTLARRHAFQAPFIFDLQLRNLHLPNSGLEYWRPGVSLLLYILHWLGATSLHGSLAVTILAGVAWAAAAWHIAMRATGSRAVALASYTLCLLLPPGWEGSLTPDPTLFYAAAVAWFLALFTVERQGLAQDIVALLCLSAAYMIRNDAGLLAAPFLVVLWRRWRRGANGSEVVKRNDGASPTYIAAMICGFLLALVPMHLLYRYVLGTAFPAGASEALYLNQLSDFSNYGVPVSMHTMLSHGFKHLVAMRVGAGLTIVYRVLALVLGYVALIFLPTLWLRSRSDSAAANIRDPKRLPELAGGVTFALVLLVVYSLILPAVGVFSALRSSTALLPLASVAVIVAIVRLAPTRKAAGVLTAGVVVAYLVSGVVDDRRLIGPMNAIGDADRAQAKALEKIGARPDSPENVVMTKDPVQFSVTTGFFTVPLAGNGVDAITNEALALHATHVILDGEHLPGSPDNITQKLHPKQTVRVPGQETLLLELPPEFSQR